MLCGFPHVKIFLRLRFPFSMNDSSEKKAILPMISKSYIAVSVRCTVSFIACG